MKTRKILSVILCIATILSLMTCCLMGGASARTYASYETKVNLTFDGEAPYGIAFNRGGYNYSYVTAENATSSSSGGYVHAGAGGGSFFVGKNGDVGATKVDGSASGDDKKAALENMFKFEHSKTYRVTFDYRFTSASSNGEIGVELRFFPNPTTSGDAYNFSQYTSSYTAKNEKVNFQGETTEWKTATYTFTVKDDEVDAYLGLRYFHEKDETTFFDIDNIKIEESAIAVSCGAKVGTLHDMNSDVAGTTVRASTDAKGSVEEVSIVELDDEHGKVLKFKATGDSPRVTFDDFKLSLNKKYYISFDAKADVAKRIMLTVAKTDTTTGKRTWVNGSNYSGLTLYVNGKKVENSNMNNFIADTEWKHFGVYLDMGDAYWQKYQSTDGTPAIGANDSVSLYFGVINTTGYFDNMQMFEITEAETNKPTATVTADYSARSAASDDGAGIRFRGTFNNSDIENAAEIGFVVATTVAAAEHNDWYKVETGTKTYALTTVCKNNTVDTVYETKDGKTSYQLILTGLKSGTNTAYELPFDVAMYVKDASDKYTYYYLGQSSYNEVLAAYSAQNITMPTK